MNNFNSVAFIYDFLAKLVFGRSILNAQVSLLGAIANHSRVLILGGGTGIILQELDKLGQSLEVTYVEPASAMITRAMQKQPFDNITVNFIQARHESILNSGTYDVILTNFFLDIFDSLQLPEVVRQLGALLKKDGVWIVTDFVSTGIWWQKLLIRFMYFFFRLTTGLEGNRLLNFKDYLSNEGLQLVKRKKFYCRMIASDLYQRG